MHRPKLPGNPFKKKMGYPTYRVTIIWIRRSTSVVNETVATKSGTLLEWLSPRSCTWNGGREYQLRLYAYEDNDFVFAMIHCGSTKMSCFPLTGFMYLGWGGGGAVTNKKHSRKD